MCMTVCVAANLLRSVPQNWPLALHIQQARDNGCMCVCVYCAILVCGVHASHDTLIWHGSVVALQESQLRPDGPSARE